MILLFSGARNAIGVQREIDNFRADSGAIAKRDADAWLITCAHARDRNRILLNRLPSPLRACHERTALFPMNRLIFPAV